MIGWKIYSDKLAKQQPRWAIEDDPEFQEQDDGLTEEDREFFRKRDAEIERLEKKNKNSKYWYA